MPEQKQLAANQLLAFVQLWYHFRVPDAVLTEFHLFSKKNSVVLFYSLPRHKLFISEFHFSASGLLSSTVVQSPRPSLLKCAFLLKISCCLGNQVSIYYVLIIEIFFKI